jgi:hypothetical protein
MPVRAVSVVLGQGMEVQFIILIARMSIHPLAMGCYAGLRLTQMTPIVTKQIPSHCRELSDSP